LQEIVYLVSNVSNCKSALSFLVAGKGRQKQQQAESQPEDCKHHVMVECDERKHQLLQAAIAQVTKQYGKESVMWLGRNQHVHVDVISTGSLTLDIALGVGGLPKGRVVEIYGPEASGKTTLALHVIAEAQKLGKGFCLFVDAEHALDLQFAEGIGVNTQDLLFVQPDAAEQALETVDTFMRSGTFDVIVIDSVYSPFPLSHPLFYLQDRWWQVCTRLVIPEGVAASIVSILPLY
jgi:recombination protein RecA